MVKEKFKTFREAWKPCPECEFYFGHNQYIKEHPEHSYRFCYQCGRPIQEDAWEELECRMIVELPNQPLTLEELREMDGEPVWIVDGAYSYYSLVTDVLSQALWIIRREDESEMLFEDYGKTWTAYRRKRNKNQ